MKVVNLASFFMVVSLAITCSTKADFILTGTQEITVNSTHFNGTLRDTSIAFLESGANIYNNLSAYTYSTMNMSGGHVNSLYSYEYSTLNIAGGDSITGEYPINDLEARQNSVVDMSGGAVGRFSTYDSVKVNISGGSLTYLQACDYSFIALDGQNFVFGNGLTLDGNNILGSGRLSGEWMDGTPFEIYIQLHDPTSTIIAVPEPATFLLFGIGSLFLSKRKKMNL